MNRRQKINFILQYAIQASFLTYQNKKDIRSIIVDNNETHSILDSMNKKNTDIDLEQLTDHSINQIFEIIEERLKFLNQPSLI
jgi:phage terminase large subunit-like protein